jgi:aminodeoxyfutalosine synthase
MNTTLSVDKALEQIAAGGMLTRAEVHELASTPDILAAGVLADALRRRRHGASVTFVRVAVCPFGELAAPGPSAAGGAELRVTGAPGSWREALDALDAARALAGSRVLAALTWADVVRYAEHAGGVEPVLHELRAHGLDALAEVALDGVASVEAVLGSLAATGFDEVRLHVARSAPAPERVDLWFRVADADDARRIACVNPLPTAISAFKPTTGYDDVKAVALARLAMPAVPHIQVDWARYGPKLAQVALTFGADDVDNVSASDDAPLGRRRAPLEEIRRNIEAAGFAAVERGGRFGPPVP